MRILFLGDARSIHLQRWIDFFNRQGDQTQLVSLEKSDIQITETTQVLPAVPWNFAKYYLAAGQIRKLVQTINPDIINAHFVPNYGLMGARLKFRPVAVSVWGSDILVSAQKSFLHKMRASWVLRQADWLTSDSRFLTDEMVKLGAEPAQISTFPLGVGREFLDDNPKKLLAKNTLIVISTRRLERLYNLQLLIRAIAALPKSSELRFNFVIVGEGPEREKLQKEVKRVGLEDSVEFKGTVSQSELAKLLKSADIYVSTSLSDSTSVSLLEAFACGLVPVVTDIPGNREWIQDEENGFLVPVQGTEVLAQRIVQIGQDLPQMQSLVERNWKKVKEKANYDGNLTSLRRKFEELIELKRKTTNV